MEQKANYKIDKKDGKIIHTTIIEKTMDYKEAMKEINQFKVQKQQQEKQVNELREQVETDVFGKNLQELETNLAKLNDLEKSWEDIIAEPEAELYKEIKIKVKGLKAKEGYDRIDKKNQGDLMLKRNKIIADVITDLELDVQHPLAMKLRREFDSI